jgi:hypothetical protein
MIYVGKVKDEFADDDLITEFDLQNANYFSNIKILSWECEDDDPVLTTIENKLKYYHEDTEYNATFYSVEEEGPAGDQSEIPEETIETYHTTQSTSYGANYYWHLEQIQKRDLTTTYHDYVYDEDGTNVDVYIIDTGINHSHLHLGDATRSFEMPSAHYNPVTYGFSNNNDDHSHGTYCSLCVGGRHDNSQGGGYGPGVAKGVQFYALKVLNSAGSGSGTTIAAAISGVLSHHNAKTATATMYVRVASSKYYINDVQTKSFNLFPGMTYKFDQSDSTNATHPLLFSITPDGEWNGGVDYTTGVTTSGTPGQAGAYTQIAVTSSTAATLYYFCDNHSGYGVGGTVTVKTSNTTVNKKPSIINISIGHGIPYTNAKYVYVDTAGTGTGDIIEDALKTAAAGGVHVVNSAGNGYDDNDQHTLGPLKTEYNIGTIGLAYPGESSNTDPGQGFPIIVGATTDNTGSGSGNATYGKGGAGHAYHTASAMAYFSNYGRANTINAPGRFVKVPAWNTFTSGNSWPISSISGTSFSCPITAGLVAQYVGLHPEAAPLLVKDWIKSIASTDVNGTGLVDLETEVDLLANPITTVAGAGTHPGTGTNTAQISLQPNHGITNSDYIQLRGVDASVGGVAASAYNMWHKVVNVAGDLVDIALLDINGAAVIPGSAETGGGAGVKFLALMQSGADVHDYTDGVIWEQDNLELKTQSGGSTGVFWPVAGGSAYQAGVCPPGVYIDPTPNRHLFMPFQEYTTTWTEGNTTTGTFGLTAVTEGASVSVDLSASMVTGHNSEQPFGVTYSVTAGSLPAGLTLNASNGLLSGTAPSLTENASYEWTIQSTNGYGIETKKYQMTVLESTTPTPVVSSVGGISLTDGITVSIT